MDFLSKFLTIQILEFGFLSFTLSGGWPYNIVEPKMLKISKNLFIRLIDFTLIFNFQNYEDDFLLQFVRSLRTLDFGTFLI